MIKNNLRNIRMKEYAMDQVEFALKIGIDLSQYNNWEHDRSRPKLELALEIAKKLNKRVEDIWYLE
jgi:DNA-binding XRE family transcriptional regulator